MLTVEAGAVKEAGAAAALVAVQPRVVGRILRAERAFAAATGTAALHAAATAQITSLQLVASPLPPGSRTHASPKLSSGRRALQRAEILDDGSPEAGRGQAATGKFRPIIR